MPEPHLMRARVLLERDRYAEAERELGQVLAEAPEHATALSLKALCELHQNRKEQAEATAIKAVLAEPEAPFAHYVLGHVLLDREKLPKARQAAEEAIRLDPVDPDHYALRAAVFLAARQWGAALRAAEEGLKHDAEHDGCLHQRTIALTQLGRHDEARQQMTHTIRRNAEDPMAHANRGWSLLHQNQPREALEAFGEAMRLAPGNSWARAGLVEALKARNPIYRVLLGFFLWMSRLSPATQAGVLIGGLVAYHIVRQIGTHAPQLKTITIPLMVLYVIFVILTWVATPAFNLLLMLNRYGRGALSGEQKQGAWVFGGFLLIPCLLFSIYLFFLAQGQAGVGSVGVTTLKFALNFGILLLPLGAVVNHLGTARAVPYGVGFLTLVAITLAAIIAEYLGSPSAEGLDTLRFYAFVGSLWFLAFAGVKPPAH